MYTPHYLLQYGGTLVGVGEIWTATMRFAQGDGSPSPDVGLMETALPDLRDDLVDRFPESLANGGLGHSNWVRLEWMKFNHIGEDGRYTSSSNTNVIDLDTPITGFTNPGAYTPQASLAVTFGTAATRGPAHAGRTYIPLPDNALWPGVGARIAPGPRQTLADNWADLLQAWGDWPGIDWNDAAPAICSGVDGTSRRITSVRVGDVMDTVRSRRNAMTEDYVHAQVDGV